MKEIIQSQIVPNNIITVDEIDFYRTDDIICYVTAGNVGIGILLSSVSGNEAGFVYHTHMVRGNFRKQTFKASTKRKAIISVLNSGRQVYSFSCYKEFLEFALKYNQY